MKASDLLAIDGVFLAVKCAICNSVYSAESDDYIAFYGSVAAGAENVILGVAPPRRPAKKAMLAVCRSPHCLEGVVRKMLGCHAEGGDAAIWGQVLRIWAESAGHALVEAREEPPVPLNPKARLKAKAR